MKRILSILPVLSIAVILASCAREEMDFAPKKDVSFLASLTTDVQTRGIPYSSEKGLDGTPFTVWAYTYDAAGTPTAQKALYGHDVKVTYNASANLWIPTENYLWPNQQKMIEFYAFAPFDAAVLDAESGAAPKLTYTVPENIPDQHGLMVAGPVVRKDNPSPAESSVELNFQHALAGITFKTGKSVKIKEVKVCGIYDTGVFNMETMEWESKAKVLGERTYTITDPETTDEGGYDVFKEDYTLMLLPQECPEGALLTVSTDQKTLEIPIDGHVWQQGKLTTYVLSRDDIEYTLYVTDPDDLTYDGNTSDTGVIYSYRTNPDGTVEPAEFTIEGYYTSREDAEAKTNPLSGMGYMNEYTPAEADNNGKSPVHINYNQSVRQRVVEDFRKSIDSRIAAKPEVGSASSYWNLANPADGSNTILETANTYTIGAPGWYRIPMVAGNGIVNNAPNTTAYNDGFFDYKDQPIAQPYLHKTSNAAGTPAAAFIVWEDTDFIDIADGSDWNIAGADGGSCITKTGEGDNEVYWLNFHLDKDKVRQGLANIAVQDQDGNVMWSWLLWVTDYQASQDVAVQAHPSYNKTYNMMDRDLGWVEIGSSTTDTWEEETVYVRIEQDKLQGKVAVMEVKRPEHVDFYLDLNGYSPYFQFGRKDPLHPGENAQGDNPLNTFGRVNQIQVDNTKSTVGTVIQHPGTHYGFGNQIPYDWSTINNKTDWWWSGNTSSSIDAATVVKTIYDPCPVGYHMPSAAAFTGFTSSGKSENVGSGVYVQSAGSVPTADDFKYGWWFSTDGASKTGFTFFATNGYRNSREGAIVNGGTGGYYWTATPNGKDHAWALMFNDAKVNPVYDEARRVRGYSVRPVTN